MADETGMETMDSATLIRAVLSCATTALTAGAAAFAMKFHSAFGPPAVMGAIAIGCGLNAATWRSIRYVYLARLAAKDSDMQRIVGPGGGSPIG